MQLNPGAAAFKPGRYHAFGKDFETKRQLNDEITRIKIDSGKEIVEIGNDKFKTKPIRKNVDVAEAARELRHRWKHG